MGDAKEEDSVVQILNDAIEQRKKRITTVENQGGDAIRLSGDFVDESARVSNRAKWFNFRKTVLGKIHNYMNEQFQHVGSNVSQEIIAKLRSKWGAAGFFKGCSRRNCWRGGKPGTNR